MNIPVELAQARAQTIEAWNEFQRVIDRDHTVSEFDEALRIANNFELAANALYDRWQNVGGTSDTVSIVESENAVRLTEPATVGEMVSASYGTHPLDDLGTHVIISGGDVLELDAPKNHDSDFSSWEDDPF